MIDTPGMSDFYAETANGIFASENVVAVINSTAGLEIQTERFGSIAKELKKGIIAFFNMFDKERAGYEETLSDLADTFERTPVLVQLPIGREADFGNCRFGEDESLYLRERRRFQGRGYSC